MSGRRSGNKGGLGRALIKAKQGGQRGNKKKGLGTFDNPDTAPPEPKIMDSVIDKSDLQQIIERAELAADRFVAEKQNVVVLNKTSFVVADKPTAEQIEAQQKHWNDVVIPRRPKWSPDMSALELDKLEKQAFLQWRRKLAEVEENEHLVLTPFERNLEIWRQLWRVIERSDLIVQILDARDPLLFRSLDLEKYIDEFKDKDPPQKKISLLLLNKADLLSDEQRKMWAEYFKSEGIRFVFFSAFQEQLKLEASMSRSRKVALNGDDAEENEHKEEEKKEGDAADSEAPQLDKEEHNEEDNTDSPQLEEQSTTEQVSEASTHTISTPTLKIEHQTDKVLTTQELFAYFNQLCEEELPEKKDHIVVGMVGYPNVGKSSTINVLYHKKKVAVSATPGKTKHFQTLKVNDRITLCDCPGLVFPTFMSSRAEMTVAGLLRIDEMRDYLTPIAIVLMRIPREELEHFYGIKLPNKPVLHPSDLLQAYARARGFYIGQEKPNESRAARLILKDYVNGRILFCRAPPTVSQAEYSKLTIHNYQRAKRNV